MPSASAFGMHVVLYSLLHSVDGGCKPGSLFLSLVLRLSFPILYSHFPCHAAIQPTGYQTTDCKCLMFGVDMARYICSKPL